MSGLSTGDVKVGVNTVVSCVNVAEDDSWTDDVDPKDVVDECTDDVEITLFVSAVTNATTEKESCIVLLLLDCS